MTEPHDWDDDEREVMADLAPHVAALRERHAGDPPLEMLAAARGQALPDEWQAEMDEHLRASRWSRAIPSRRPAQYQGRVPSTEPSMPASRTPAGCSCPRAAAKPANGMISSEGMGGNTFSSSIRATMPA